MSGARRVVSCAVTAFAVMSCGGGGDGFVNPPPVVVIITPSGGSVNVGATTSFAVSITGGTTAATLASCSSSATAIATAAVSGSSCVATGVAAGTATITATSSAGQAAAVQLTVIALPPALTAFTLTPPTASLTVGQTQALTAVPTNPAGATVSITYVSGNTAVATVATNGVITAVGVGSAIVTATAQATGPNLAPTTIAQTSTITVAANPCAATVYALPITRTGSVSTSSCALTTDLQRRGDVLRFTLVAAAAVELRFVPVGFAGFVTAFPAADPEFVFSSGTVAQEVRRTWHLPSGLTEIRIGTAAAGQSGSYSFSAAIVSAAVTGCSPVVVAGSLESPQSLASGDCVYSGRVADEYLVYSARSCVITMTRSTASAMTNPYLEVYAGTQLYVFDNDGGLNLNARISLASCRSPANDVLIVRATSLNAGDVGNYQFSVTFGP